MSQRADFDRDIAILREDLAELVAKTPGADRLAPPGAFIGPPKKRGAAWRRVEDDAAAGRLSYRAAHFAAKHGLAALDAVDLARAALVVTEDIDALERLCAEIDAGVELARAALDHAGALYTDAFERVAGPKGLASLQQSAQPRGRAPSAAVADRNRRLAEAVDRQIAAGKKPGKAALAAALKADAALAAEIAGAGHGTLEKAMRKIGGTKLK